ncbi:MAG: PilN domain-containing protein [Chloroflexota bacterium]
MTGKLVTLYIDNTQIKLLVTGGKRIKKMAELRLELTSRKISAGEREAEIASKIQQLLTAKKVSASKIILGLSGLHCLTRPFSLPQLPKTMQTEAVMREAKRVLPVPIDQLYISWQIFPGITEGQSRGFLVGIPRKTADMYVNVLRRAGLKPYLVDLKPLAICRLVQDDTAIVVDIQPADFDIVVMSKGIPQPIRTVSFPQENLPQEEKLALVKEEITRTIDFYNANSEEGQINKNVPLYVSGELDDVTEAATSLSGDLGLTLKELASPLKCPKELDPSHYLVNIGLALKEMVTEKEPAFSLVNINALPTPYRPKPLPLMKLLSVPVAVSVVGIITLMGMFVYNASASIAAARTELDTTNQIIETRQTQKEELTKTIAGLETKISQTKAATRTFLTVQNLIDRQGGLINGDLSTSAAQLIADMQLTGINHSNGALTIRGSTLTEEEILTYARRLEQSGRFGAVNISNILRVVNEEETEVGIETTETMTFTIALEPEKETEEE